MLLPMNLTGECGGYCKRARTLLLQKHQVSLHIRGLGIAVWRSLMSLFEELNGTHIVSSGTGRGYALILKKTLPGIL